MTQAIRVFIDADACPVKDEVYRVAARYRLKTLVVANAYIMVPASPLIERVVVEAKTVEKLIDANFRQWPLKEGGIKRVVHTRS